MPEAGATKKKLVRGALLGLVVLGLLAAAGLGVQRWQESQAAAAAAEEKERRRHLAEDEMTPRQYQHLQNLPAYGVVRPGSPLDARIRQAAADGGR